MYAIVIVIVGVVTAFAESCTLVQPSTDPDWSNMNKDWYDVLNMPRNGGGSIDCFHWLNMTGGPDGFYLDLEVSVEGYPSSSYRDFFDKKATGVYKMSGDYVDSFIEAAEKANEHRMTEQLAAQIVQDMERQAFVGTTATVTTVEESRELASSIQNGKNPGRKASSRSFQIIWKNLLLMTGLHIVSIYAIFRITQFTKFTLFFGVACYVLSIQGITAGAHRLWSHRTYKAKLPLRIILMILNSMALQNSIFHWSRDHRSHHKYSETDADPHNSQRGFFFCHFGWLIVHKHSEVAKKGKLIKMDDLMNDPVVAFQNRYYVPLAITFCFVVPTIIPWAFGGETLLNAYCAAALRYCIVLHVTWTVNSFAHMFGERPYDKFIPPAENEIVNYFALGEGHHNYHHTFPYDYAASEFGKGRSLTTIFIDFMALIGQAYDRKIVSKATITARQKRTGELQTENE